MQQAVALAAVAALASVLLVYLGGRVDAKKTRAPTGDISLWIDQQQVKMFSGAYNNT